MSQVEELDSKISKLEAEKERLQPLYIKILRYIGGGGGVFGSSSMIYILCIKILF